MYKSCLFSILFLLAFPAVAMSAEEPKMFSAEYRILSPQIKEGTFEASPRKVWRIGFQYLRLEEQPDPAQKIHSLIISKAPDSYIINRYSKTGDHLVDRAENTDIHLPVFQSQDLPEEIKELEMGNENAFIAKYEIPVAGVRTVEGIECDVHQMTVKEFQLTICIRKDNGNPIQMGLKKEDMEYHVRYLKYEPNLKPDYSLFQVPKGIRIKDVN